MAVNTPECRFPQGVTPGLWDYVHSDAIASDYDEYFASNQLFRFDRWVLLCELERRLRAGAVVADLGCGTGRAVLAAAERGFRGLAIDLSERMLQIVREKADARQLSVDYLQANLVELDAVRDHSVDAAACLFSTLGMIRGVANRQSALLHFHRVLRRKGILVLHVHNYWYSLRDPGGPWWIVKSCLRGLFGSRLERGDKFFSYRGIPQMFLHVFTYREIRRDLRQAGFEIVRMIPLDPGRHQPLCWPRLLGRWRANGWIIVAVS